METIAVEKDPRWPNESFEDFCQNRIPQIYLKSNVHDEIKEGFRIIRKLLEHSYFEYQFYDEAASKALVILEMALRIRYKEVQGDPGKKTLAPLMRWAYQNSFLEVNNEDFVKNVSVIRNHLTHLHQNSIGGPGKRQLIIMATNLVNDIYEDPELRKKRSLVQKQIQEVLQTMRPKGILLKHESEHHLIFEVWPAFTNNKLAPGVTFLYAKPIFHIPENWFDQKGTLYDSPTFLIEAVSVKIQNSKLVFHDRENKSYQLCNIESEEDQKSFEEWSKLFEGYSNQTAERFHINTLMNKTFQQHLSDFHKMH